MMKINTDSFWLASMVALTAHSLLILACIFGETHFEGYACQENTFFVDMVFVQAEAKPYFSHSMPHKTLWKKSPQPKKAVQTSATQFFKKSQLSKTSKDSSPSTLAPTLISTSSPSNTSFSSPIYAPAPIYPLEARKNKIQGTVFIRLFLTQTGKVQKAIPLHPRTKPILENAALTTIHTWRFKPGPQIIEVPIEFKLDI